MTGFGPKLGCKDALEDHEMLKKKQNKIKINTNIFPSQFDWEYKVIESGTGKQL